MRSRWGAVGLFAMGLLLVAFAVFLGTRGAEQAGAWAGVGSFFVGVIALGVAVWGVRVAAGGTGTSSDDRPRRQAAGRRVRQRARASRGGTVVQAGRDATVEQPPDDESRSR